MMENVLAAEYIYIDSDHKLCSDEVIIYQIARDIPGIRGGLVNCCSVFCGGKGSGVDR
jgi:hypothetical protein